MENAETKLTRSVRLALETKGAHCVKLSDKFTRGVPDMMVVSDRVVMVEFKIMTTTAMVLTYSRLGLSGAQDHHIRQIARRAYRGVCVITGSSTGEELAVWVPVNPELESLEGLYRRAASHEKCISWVLG